MIRVLAVALLAWEPLNLAAEALAVLPTLAYRGTSTSIELVAHALVATLNAGAGLALLNGTALAHRLAVIAVVTSCGKTIQSLYFSVLPHQTIPGHEPFIAGTALLAAAVALAVIHRSARASR